MGRQWPIGNRFMWKGVARHLARHYLIFISKRPQKRRLEVSHITPLFPLTLLHFFNSSTRVTAAKALAHPRAYPSLPFLQHLPTYLAYLQRR